MKMMFYVVEIDGVSIHYEILLHAVIFKFDVILKQT